MHVILDGAALPDKEALHAHLAQSLAFPDWYGGNLDALFDCLTDLREDTKISVRRQPELETALGPYAARLLRVLRAAAAENPHIRLVVD